LPKPDDAKQIAEALKGLTERPPPPHIQGTLIALETDEAGDPAAVITVFLADKTPDSDWVSSRLDPIADFVRNAVRESGVDRYPYVRFAKWSDAPKVDGFDADDALWRRVG
jgi:hypothetical protein